MKHLDVSPEELGRHADALERVEQHLHKAAEAALYLSNHTSGLYGAFAESILEPELTTDVNHKMDVLFEAQRMAKSVSEAIRDTSQDYRDLEQRNEELSKEINKEGKKR